MDFKIRTTKTNSGNTAVQVINYVKRKTIVLKHIGSAHNDIELEIFKKEAQNWILDYQNENSLFKNEFNEIETFNKTYKYLDIKLNLNFVNQFEMLNHIQTHHCLSNF